MSNSSPSVSRNLPTLSPATAARTVRSTSTGATPNSAALSESMLQVEVGAQPARGVVDVARALGRDHEFLGLVRQLLQLVEVGTDDGDLDRRVDRRAVAITLDDDAGACVIGERPPQVLEQLRRRARIEALQLDEHLADVRLRLLGEDVVVHARIAAADVGEDVLHFLVSLQLGLDEAHRAIRLGEARSRRRLDGDAELRDVRVREQAEAEQRGEAERRQHERQRREQGAPGRAERDAQRRPVDAVDHAHQALHAPGCPRRRVRPPAVSGWPGTGSPSVTRAARLPR